METPLKSEVPNPQKPNPNSPSPLRLWRPAAQKNIRNQWSKLHAAKDRWFSASSAARSHATSLINAHLSQRYLPNMDLGALKDMPGIRQKASEKLEKKQEIYRRELLTSYKDMVASVGHMVQSSSSMRCFLKASGVGALVQFCDRPEDVNDPGDGGGIPRLLVLELLSFNHENGGERTCPLSWLYELYPGEFDELRTSNLLSHETNQPVPPRIEDWQSGDPLKGQSRHACNHEVLQVYLTTWLADVNIDMNRVREIFSMVEEEIQVKLL